MTTKTVGLPAGWKYVPVPPRRGYYRHDGCALNRCRWLKPAIWTVSTDEEKQTAVVRCFWHYYTQNGHSYRHEAATLTIVGDTMAVGEGPWKITPQPDETPLLAAIRWVQHQENAAQQLGSK